MNEFIFALISIFIYVNIGFLISVILKRNDIADVMWGPGIFLSVVSFYLVHKTNSSSANIFLVLVGLWAGRIFLHIGTRFIKKSTEDARYAIWRQTWEYFYLRSYFQVFILQGFLMFVVSSTVLVFMYSNYNLVFPLGIIGIIISLFGLCFEATADLQLNAFIKNKLPTEKILKSGLWKYTRHPNYFGEVTFWWGIFIATLPNLNIFLLISPLAITYLILYVSGIPLLEKKYIGDAEFQEYKRKTNAFFPWFPKK